MTTTIIIIGLIILLILVVVGILIKNKKSKVNTTETTTETTTENTTETTTTVTVQQVYYNLYKCVPNGIDYYTGPLELGSFQTGDRVEGATDTFYTVTASTETTPTGTHIDVTGTNLKGC